MIRFLLCQSDGNGKNIDKQHWVRLVSNPRVSALLLTRSTKRSGEVRSSLENTRLFATQSTRNREHSIPVSNRWTDKLDGRVSPPRLQIALTRPSAWRAPPDTICKVTYWLRAGKPVWPKMRFCNRTMIVQLKHTIITTASNPEIV
jgi:hypothetical protein